MNLCSQPMQVGSVSDDIEGQLVFVEGRLAVVLEATRRRGGDVVPGGWV